MTEETLFHQARERPPEERAAFLEAACGGDAALRGRLEALLRAADEPGSFLNAPPAAAVTGAYTPARGPANATAPCEGAGAVIGPYKLLEQIGEGGFGVVFLA